MVHAFCKRQLALVSEGVQEARGHVMLVVPSTLLDNWAAEFRKWINKPNQGTQGVEVKVEVLSTATCPTMSNRIAKLRTWEAKKRCLTVCVRAAHAVFHLLL